MVPFAYLDSTGPSLTYSTADSETSQAPNSQEPAKNHPRTHLALGRAGGHVARAAAWLGEVQLVLARSANTGCTSLLGRSRMDGPAAL